MLEDTEVDGLDVPPGGMLEDDRLPIDGRKFGAVRYSNPPGDALEVDVAERELVVCVRPPEGAT
jgi:hypothetical protein